MKRFLTFAATLLATLALTPPVSAQQPPVVDGLLWGVEPTTGESAPFLLPNPSPAANGPYIAAFGKLDRVKYHGYGTTPRISYDVPTLFMAVTKLNAQGETIDTQKYLFQTEGDDETGNFSFDTTQRWDPKADRNGATVPFAGFPPGQYRIEIEAKVKLTTQPQQNPPPLPPTPGTTTTRKAILLVKSFQVQ